MIAYVESKDKVVEIDDRFKHLMALALNPKTNNKDGLIRCITSRVGEVYVSGYIDKSELHLIKMIDNYHYSISHKLKIINEDEIIKSVTPIDYEFLGLEDPDIYMDENNSMLHVYLTIPFVSKIDSNLKIYLGHAEGMDLDSLIMTDLFIKDDNISAKEISLAPPNSR